MNFPDFIWHATWPCNYLTRLCPCGLLKGCNATYIFVVENARNHADLFFFSIRMKSPSREYVIQRRSCQYADIPSAFIKTSCIFDRINIIPVLCGAIEIGQTLFSVFVSYSYGMNVCHRRRRPSRRSLWCPPCSPRHRGTSTNDHCPRHNAEQNIGRSIRRYSLRTLHKTQEETLDVRRDSGPKLLSSPKR